MKKYLLLLITLILFIPNVKADIEYKEMTADDDLHYSSYVAKPSSSANLLPNVFLNHFYFSQYTGGGDTFQFKSSSAKIPATTSTGQTVYYSTYLVPYVSGNFVIYNRNNNSIAKFNSLIYGGELYFAFFNEDYQYIASSYGVAQTVSTPYEVKPQEFISRNYTINDVKYFNINVGGSQITTRNYPIFDLAYYPTGSDTSTFIPYEEYIEPEPETPPIDNPDVPPANIELLGNFYSIYFDKLKMINNYAEENPLFMATIGIIILFIILEIFINLFHLKGGRYHE